MRYIKHEIGLVDNTEKTYWTIPVADICRAYKRAINMSDEHIAMSFSAQHIEVWMGSKNELEELYSGSKVTCIYITSAEKRSEKIYRIFSSFKAKKIIGAFHIKWEKMMKEIETGTYDNITQCIGVKFFHLELSSVSDVYLEQSDTETEMNNEITDRYRMSLRAGAFLGKEDIEYNFSVEECKLNLKVDIVNSALPCINMKKLKCNDICIKVEKEAAKNSKAGIELGLQNIECRILYIQSDSRIKVTLPSKRVLDFKVRTSADIKYCYAGDTLPFRIHTTIDTSNPINILFDMPNLKELHTSSIFINDRSRSPRDVSIDMSRCRKLEQIMPESISLTDVRVECIALPENLKILNRGISDNLYNIQRHGSVRLLIANSNINLLDVSGTRISKIILPPKDDVMTIFSDNSMLEAPEMSRTCVVSKADRIRLLGANAEKIDTITVFGHEINIPYKLACKETSSGRIRVIGYVQDDYYNYVWEELQKVLDKVHAWE